MENQDKRFSPTVIDHAKRPRNAGELEDCDAYGVGGDLAAGESVVLFIKVRDGVICDCTFLARGCSSVIAAGSMTTELLKGKTLASAAALTAAQLTAALGGLPAVKLKSAELAIAALHDALARYAADIDE
ncbi:MAG: iron-sulfur cluster assembly scaffold protein [Eubacteriales bacterium]|nr:iron-sulfur cluster assembly scaffold protein [Eubacteriales bacterium]